MAKYKTVRFLKYFNRPRVFVAIEIDTILLALGVFIFFIFMLSFSSVVNGFLVFTISFAASTLSARSYTKYKDTAAKGFLKHLLYKYHIYRVNTKEFKTEVKRMDMHPDEYYPDTNDKLFVE